MNMPQKHRIQKPVSNAPLIAAKREETKPRLIVDWASEEVVPYIIHFSKRGYAAKVVSVEMNILNIEEVQGPRLNAFMQTAGTEQLVAIYSHLGTILGYFAKYGIEHGHPHSNNVIIQNNMPVIVDWDHGNILGYSTDSAYVLDDLTDCLKIYNRSEIYPLLEKSFNESFAVERAKPLDLDHRGVRMAALIEFGVI